MKGFEFVSGVDCNILLSTFARLVPRCGVERKTIAEIALTMASYSGSF
jgi:hypothetical protein